MQHVIFILQLLIAAALGVALGWQRQHIGKAAGLRTFAFVTLGSCLFTILSLNAFGGDGGRVAAQIVTGIGFIGAGTIIHQGKSIEGLTTAAGLWSAAAIGMAVGAEWFIEASLATIVMLVLFFWDDDQPFSLRFLNRKMGKKSQSKAKKSAFVAMLAEWKEELMPSRTRRNRRLTKRRR